MVFDDGTKVNKSVTKDILPEVGWEGWGIALGIKAADCILDVKVVDDSEDPGLPSIRDVSVRQPRCFTSGGAPVPGIVWVVHVRIAPHSFVPALLIIILIITQLAQSVEDTDFIFLSGIPSRSRRVFSFSPMRSSGDLDCFFFMGVSRVAQRLEESCRAAAGARTESRVAQ